MEAEENSDSKLDKINNKGESNDILFIVNRLHGAWSTRIEMWTRPNHHFRKRRSLLMD